MAFRKINVSFWQDSFVLEELTPEDKYFYLYLMTNSKTNQLGCFSIPIKVIELETGYCRESILKLLDRFCNTYNKILYCKETSEILILNWGKYNWSKSPKVLSCILSDLKNVKNTEFKRFLVNLLLEKGYSIDTVSIEYGEEKEKEEEKEEEQEQEKSFGGELEKKSEKEDLLKLFDKFYKFYPKKKNVERARKAFLKLKPTAALVEKMIEAIFVQSKSEQWQKDKGQFIPYPEAWLNAHAWEDVPEVYFTSNFLDTLEDGASEVDKTAIEILRRKQELCL